MDDAHTYSQSLSDTSLVGLLSKGHVWIGV